MRRARGTERAARVATRGGGEGRRAPGRQRVFGHRGRRRGRFLQGRLGFRRIRIERVRLRRFVRVRAHVHVRAGLGREQVPPGDRAHQPSRFRGGDVHGRRRVAGGDGGDRSGDGGTRGRAFGSDDSIGSDGGDEEDDEEDDDDERENEEASSLSDDDDEDAAWTPGARLPAPQPVNQSFSLFSILRHAIGKDLTKISLPATINQPLTIIQRTVEDLEYIHLLYDALDARGSIE